MFKIPIEGVQDEAEGDFCPDAAGGTIAPDCKKHHSSTHPSAWFWQCLVPGPPIQCGRDRAGPQQG